MPISLSGILVVKVLEHFKSFVPLPFPAGPMSSPYLPVRLLELHVRLFSLAQRCFVREPACLWMESPNTAELGSTRLSFPR